MAENVTIQRKHARQLVDDLGILIGNLNDDQKEYGEMIDNLITSLDTAQGDTTIEGERSQSFFIIVEPGEI